MTRHHEFPGNGPGEDNAAAANAGAGTGGGPTDDRVDRAVPDIAGFDRAVPDIDGEPAIADTLYAATEELEHAAPELRARADSIAEVIGPLVHTTDPAMLQIDDPDPATSLPDDQAEHLAELLTEAAAQANSLATVLMEAADQADGLAAVLTDEHTGNE